MASEPTPNTPSELRAALEKGDVREQGRILERYLPWLRLLSRVQMESQLRRKFDPSDLVQQTLLEAYRGLPGFRGTTEAELTAWLRRILHRVLLHEIRRYHATKKRQVSREISLSPNVEPLLHAERRTGTASPSEIAQSKEQELVIARILEELRPEYREVIILRQLEELPYEEVAARMERSQGAVRMLWVRALAQFRKKLGDDFRDP